MMGDKDDSIVKDNLLGNIQVYKEYKPRLDAIEYTVFFREPSSAKFRMDFTLSNKAFDKMTSKEMEGYVTGRIHERYERGEFVPAISKVMGTRKGYILENS